MRAAHAWTGVLTVTLLLGLAMPAGATPTFDADDYAEPTDQMLEDSVRQYSLDGSVQTVETTRTEGGETTIGLAADILFEPDRWDLSQVAQDRIAELVAEVPGGASVAVGGHTDSVDGAVDNRTLSENRANAVADVIAEARPDLVLEVAGYADTDPAVAEDPDDPTTRAANRRVEITYEG